MEKVVIFDIGIASGGKNKIFNKDFAYNISHTLLPLCYLHEEAKKLGITFITPDVFLDNPEEFNGKKVLLMSHLISSDTEKMIAKGAIPLLLTCQESPFVATRFYLNLNKYTSLFKFSMLFPGMKKRASPLTTFLPMFFPQFFLDETFEPIPFKDKKVLVYIASNKENKGLLKVLFIKLTYGLNVRAVYSLRKKLIRIFKDVIELYGRGWDTEKSDYIKAVYKGEVADKEKEMRGYKFALCLENTIFPGYITEKIFDCFFAGCVPLYLGTPDIKTYIPENTFIDINKFKNLDDLRKAVVSIDESTYNNYLNNIKDFLNSEGYKKFSHEKFAQTALDIIKNY